MSVAGFFTRIKIDAELEGNTTQGWEVACFKLNGRMSLVTVRRVL